MMENVLRGDFTGWHGLPPGTTLDAVLAALAPARKSGPPRERVRGPRRHLVVAVERDAPPAEIEIWCGIDGRTVESIELEPAGIDGDAVLAQLGEPELRLPDERFAEGGMATEHVYASRGVTASIVQPFDAAQPRRVGYLQLYGATGLSEYLTEIGVAAHPRPHTTKP